eukprot:Gb_29553 [translate_table: standard]
MERFGSFGAAALTLAAALLLSVWCAVGLVKAQSSPPALFVFGDSLVDSGNNNYLPTSARADNTPYGIDYPSHRPTGRFSNGLNIPDIISERLGAESVLPYLDPALTGTALLRGANFASAGVGILNDTGIQFVAIIRIWQQFEYFRAYQARLAAHIGHEATNRLVSKGLVTITLGGNDYVNNYYLTPFSARSREYSLPAYTRFIISEYKKQLMRLYELGARRVMVTATGPLGCVPAEVAMRSRNGQCDQTLQTAANLFNGQLSSTVNDLNRQLGARIYTFANAFNMNMDFISNPRAFGFETSKIACCGQGPYNGIGLCNAASNLCPNRDTHVFWDPFHPSERANRMIVARFMDGDSSDMSPMNLKTMMGLDV